MEPQHLESLYPKDARKTELQQLLAFLKSGKSCQLIALPGVGRGNTLGFLAYNRNARIYHFGEQEQANYHFVLANMSEVKNRSLFDTMKFLFLELASSLHERRREEEFLVIDRLFKQALSYQDELVLFQELKNAIGFLALEKNISVIFLLDRFETYIPQATERFFNNLRSIRNRAKYKFSVVFATTRPLEDALEPEILADFYEFVADNHVYLLLADDAGLLFRRNYLENLTGKHIADKTYHDILMQTAGHGKLTRLALEAILAKNGQKDRVPEAFLLEQKTIQSALAELWRFLTPDEQQDIQMLCQGKECPLPSEFLQKVGLIKNNAIAIPLFRAFVHQIAKTLPAQAHFTLDEATNAILRDKINISDQLTLSEFRLLRLLLTHEGSVIDREAIVQAVWSDSKTQAGVSEQAVDQLIFRLRKKIEDDPTRPSHVVTIKGRGVQFVQ